MSSVSQILDFSPVLTQLETLTGRLTEGRAGNLDNLNASVSSRASAGAVAGIPTSPVKSIQRGWAQFVIVGNANDSAYMNVAVSAVVAAKCSVSVKVAKPSQQFESDPSYYFLAGQLYNATTLRIYGQSTSAVRKQIVYWEVVEYE